MRLPAAVALAALSLTLPAAAQSSRVACEMAPQAALEQSLGAPGQIVERVDQDGISLCKWQAGDGLIVKLHSITAASQGISGGTPLEYFEQHEADRIANVGAANITTLEGPWQSAQIIDVTTEPNPQQFYSITFLNKDDTVTVETYGMPKQSAVDLAEAVAGAM
ncbi:hypothetical protein ABIB57_001629 [Devosia sp. UYZn731]|uniref:hypothetical protein n=1 Tax=Devosia sp. UYZn731 TaxID=3156345 RepID=UPI003397850B